MTLPDRNRSVTLICQTCAGTDFVRASEFADAAITCAGCGRVYTREGLITENGESIQASVDEVKAEIVADVRQQFREAFRGLKHFKVR